MTYIKLKIHAADVFQEYLIAELSDLGFNGFQQLDEAIITYQPKELFSQAIRDRVEGILDEESAGAFIESEEEVVQTNWNKKWEQTIQPQTIGRFFIKPTWSPEGPPRGQITIEIDPKMAFGTGYHATTRLPLQSLPRLIQPSDEVLDAGTGTGILAIAAVKLGAAGVLAFDIDEWSIKNAQENASLNGVTEAISIKEGSTEVIPVHASFDVIMANIERNTLLGMLPVFVKHLKKEGRLFLSGLLSKDQELLVRQLQAYNFKNITPTQENEWVGLWAEM